MLERIRVRRAWGASVLAALAVVVLIVALGSAGGGVAGATTEPLVAASAKLVPISPTIKPKLANCGAITGLTDLAANPQYPTAIASSTDVAAANGNPEYCDVKGMIAPQTHFDLQLPVNSWQAATCRTAAVAIAGPWAIRPSRPATRNSAVISRWPPTTRGT